LNIVDEAHAAVLDLILAMPRGSPESHAAHRAYQAARLATVPKLLQQKALLERALIAPPAVAGALDAQVTALDEVLARDWRVLAANLDESLRRRSA
jgi:HPt (histidine-containing phosphotransfer) domain-containing protein